MLKAELGFDPSKLKVGDRVVYRDQGTCRVTGFAVQEIAGQKLDVVTLEREQDGAALMVPRRPESMTSALLRTVITVVAGVAVLLFVLWIIHRHQEHNETKCQVIAQNRQNATIDELVWFRKHCP